MPLPPIVIPSLGRKAHRSPEVGQIRELRQTTLSLRMGFKRTSLYKVIYNVPSAQSASHRCGFPGRLLVLQDLLYASDVPFFSYSLYFCHFPDFLYLLPKEH